MTNTKAFIEAFGDRINCILPSFYEEAPAQSSVFPRSVFGGINIIPISDQCFGDMISFYVDLWADEKKTGATEELEALCDALRNELTGEVISKEGIFTAHLGFDNQNTVQDNEFDLCHRRLSMSARIFYF